VAIAAAFDAAAAPALVALATMPGGGGAAAEPLENATAAAAAPRPTDAMAVADAEMGLGPDKLTAGRLSPVARAEGFAQGLSSGDAVLVAGCGIMGGAVGIGGGGGAAGCDMGGGEAGIAEGANGVALGTLVEGGATAAISPLREVASHFGAASPGAGNSGAGADAGAPEGVCGTNGRPSAAGRTTDVLTLLSAPPLGGGFDESTAASAPRAKGIVPGRDGIGAD
jgi:hypothetical protein